MATRVAKKQQAVTCDTTRSGYGGRAKKLRQKSRSQGMADKP
jgi:hypothetical protein